MFLLVQSDWVAPWVSLPYLHLEDVCGCKLRTLKWFCTCDKESEHVRRPLCSYDYDLCFLCSLRPVNVSTLWNNVRLWAFLEFGRKRGLWVCTVTQYTVQKIWTHTDFWRRTGPCRYQTVHIPSRCVLRSCYRPKLQAGFLLRPRTRLQASSDRILFNKGNQEAARCGVTPGGLLPSGWPSESFPPERREHRGPRSSIWRGGTG